MKMFAFMIACIAAMYVGSPILAQKTPEPAKPKVVAVDTNRLDALAYDAGMVKFIAESADTNGAYAVVELTEMPGYKTAWHQHNNCEEAFYVVEGTLTIKLIDKTYEMPTGSYILIPRGTPHGQGNFTGKPVRLLTTFTPGGFDVFFRDRVDLFKTVKPSQSGFQSKFDALREKHKRWVEILGIWTPKE
jgi:quercetin dioxygenase-like cupin family protein